MHARINSQTPSLFHYDYVVCISTISEVTYRKIAKVMLYVKYKIDYAGFKLSGLY